MRTFWSSFGELDNLLNKSPEEKREILRDWYDPDMIDKLEDDQLDEVISDDPTIYDDAARDFEDEIAPMISSQVRNGLIFDEKFNLIDPVKLLDFDGYSAELDEDEVGDLSFNVEGRKAFPLYGFSEDDNEFIEQLRGLGVLDTLHNLYPDMDDEDFDDPYYWEDLIPFDWEMLGQNLTHVKDLGNLGESCDEQLDEAKAKNPTKLADELEEIKDLAEEYGREYFTQMPFTSFDNDPISIEYQYPEFFRVVKSFFKEMEILSPEELNDPDELDVQWDQGIDKHDWDVLMKVCDKLAQGKGTQIEKEYKTGYNSPLDDDEILANREEESLQEDAVDGGPDTDGPDGHGGYWEDGWHYDENGHIYCYQLVDANGDVLDSIGDFESAKYELKYNPDAVKIVLVKSKDESFRWFDDVEEVVWEKGIDESLLTKDAAEVINEARKYEVDNNFVYIGTGDDQSDIGEIWDDGTLELYHPEQFDAKERAKMKKDLANYNISFLDESLNEAFKVGQKFNCKATKYDPELIGTITRIGSDYKSIDGKPGPKVIGVDFTTKDGEHYGGLVLTKAQLNDYISNGEYLPIDESLNEDEQFGSLVGENNAEDFLQYLHANDCEKTGYFGDEPVKIDYIGDAFEIHLYSQAADMTFTFYRDGKVEVTGYDDDGDTETEFNEYFEDYASFVEWYKLNNISWGSDLGASLGEALNEDTETWPWGDPNSNIPKKETKLVDDTSLDKMID